MKKGRVLAFLCACACATAWQSLDSQHRLRAVKASLTTKVGNWKAVTAHAYQIEHSTACWFLAFLESLRQSGALVKLIDKIDLGTPDADKTTWKTPAGKTGTVTYNSKSSVPRWQQLLASIFLLNHPGKTAFQSSVSSMQGLPNAGRTKLIEEYLKLLSADLTISMTHLMSVPNVVKTKQEMATFFEQPALAATKVIVYTVDKPGHAIGSKCMEKTAKGNFKISTYNQQTQKTGKFTYNGAKGTCKSENDSTCSLILKFEVSGITDFPASAANARKCP